MIPNLAMSPEAAFCAILCLYALAVMAFWGLLLTPNELANADRYAMLIVFTIATLGILILMTFMCRPPEPKSTLRGGAEIRLLSE